MIDRGVIQDKIRFIEGNISKLKVLGAIPEGDFLREFYYVESAKHLLQVSIEAMIDIANHVIARERFRAPKSYADSFSILAENGILSKDMLEPFLKMARFRNRVVHLYHEVDDLEVYRILQEELGDFKFFIGAIVKRYLQQGTAESQHYSN